ncbi:putative membrane protein YccC [Bradyrhizobium japonicum]|uniref:FUSC family protein n=1 Tax=Bradyrhizobium japonicum TaxID=375 RepID=UPI00216720A4|nr:FUSC family protein [Bradyrhizobium japonicum]MCS3497766.1 putative membrane protein YccC [Bradyrhizobium japonicum]MCS3960073.1 putative membrane protein YccC [Bradyrhizobium japonicum]MCS4001826.1 putative membrane protein YccC [Bradyrhizobium japonicum]
MDLVHRNGLRLLKLVNTLLDFSRRAATVVLLFAPKADGAHVDSLGFTIGISLAAVCAAAIAFAVLPNVETFVGFDLMIGLYLVPAGALMALTWPAATLAAMAGTFVQVLSPTNQMVYDPMQFYNAALATIAGCAVAALSFRLLPPLSPALRVRRMLASTLRDLRELSRGNRARLSLADWERRMYGRLEAMPEASEPLRRGLLIMALAVGAEMIVLRRIAPQLGIGQELDLALADLATGGSGISIVRLAGVDRRLATLTEAGARASLVGRARSAILAICDALDQHRSYFDGGAVR